MSLFRRKASYQIYVYLGKSITSYSVLEITEIFLRDLGLAEFNLEISILRVSYFGHKDLIEGGYFGDKLLISEIVV